VPRPAIFVALVFVGACASRPPATLHEIAEDYVRLTLQFAQHQPTLVDAWVGPASWRPGPRRPVAELRTELDDLRQRLDDIGEVDRTERTRLDYLRHQVGALTVAARRLSGESTRFAEEFEAFFANRAPPGEGIDLTRERAALEREVAGDGTLVDRIDAFRRRFVVPPDRVDAVFRSAVEACRRETSAHIQLPSGERVDIQFDGDNGAGSAEYLGRHQTRVRLSSREGHDVAELLHLACHETYPGHHLQHVLIDDALVRGRGWIEFQLTPAFGAHAMLSEGWAEAGVDLATPPDVSARIFRETMLPLSGLQTDEADRLARVAALTAPFASEAVAPVARYVDNEQAHEATVAALRDRALLTSPERVIALADRRRAGAILYGPAKLAVSSLYRSDEPNARWRMLHDVFTVTPFVMP
jgi:hypothetical protein